VVHRACDRAGLPQVTRFDCESGGHERKRGTAGQRARALLIQPPGEEELAARMLLV
jgi:hypothetical protein